jgi:hypothetical protein
MFKFLAAAVLMLSSIAPTSMMAGEPPQLALYWPKALVNGRDEQQINEIRLSLDCAEFRGIKNIPPDWNVEVIRPISERAEMHLSAGHGASDLSNLKALDGAIVIGEQESDCFRLSVTIITEDREIKLDAAKLRFVAVGGG